MLLNVTPFNHGASFRANRTIAIFKIMKVHYMSPVPSTHQVIHMLFEANAMCTWHGLNYSLFFSHLLFVFY